MSGTKRKPSLGRTLQVLRECNGNQSEAAATLGVSAATVREHAGLLRKEGWKVPAPEHVPREQPSDFKLPSNDCLPEEALSDAQPYARRVQLALANGNYALAQSTIIEHMRARIQNSTPVNFETPLSECGVNLRMLNALETADVMTIGDLSLVSLERLRGIGNVAEREIFNAMQSSMRMLAPQGVK